MRFGPRDKILQSTGRGQQQLAQEAKTLCNPEIRWLGAFPSDFEKYFLPKDCLLPLTANGEDFILEASEACATCKEMCLSGVKFLLYLLQSQGRCNLLILALSAISRSELELIFQRRVKFEIEALSVQSISFLSREYIPSKINDVRAWNSSSRSSFTTYLPSQ